MTSEQQQQKIKLRTTCHAEIWSGFFGTNADGYQPDCEHEFEIEVDAEEVEINDDGEAVISSSVPCPKCGCLLEWPQTWEIV